MSSAIYETPSPPLPVAQLVQPEQLPRIPRRRRRDLLQADALELADDPRDLAGRDWLVPALDRLAVLPLLLLGRGRAIERVEVGVGGGGGEGGEQGGGGVRGAELAPGAVAGDERGDGQCGTEAGSLTWSGAM